MIREMLTTEDVIFLNDLLENAVRNGIEAAIKPYVEALEKNTETTARAAKAIEDYIEHRWYRV